MSPAVPLTEAELALLPADPALRAAIRGWSVALAQERRMAGNTVEAYTRDLRQFLEHLERRGGTPSIAGAPP